MVDELIYQLNQDYSAKNVHRLYLSKKVCFHTTVSSLRRPPNIIGFNLSSLSPVKPLCTLRKHNEAKQIGVTFGA